MASLIQSRTRVKVCGLTRLEDVQAACALGVDAIGLVFYAPSPRAVTIVQAQEILRDLPPFVTVTALFVNPTMSEVQSVISGLPIGLLQFHGEETPDFCTQFQRPFIKAIAMKESVDFEHEAMKWSDALGLLVDTYKPGVAGGTGETFDWERLPDRCAKPIVLAGGLNEHNVAAAIRGVRPWAVDVSGGVELAKGMKDDKKMAQFISQVALTDKGLI
jgi:phosphoribosylanthranilate isomerase